MIGSEQHGADAPIALAATDPLGGVGAPVASRYGWRRAFVTLLLLAAALGAFVQVQALHDTQLVAAGRRVPALGWLAGGCDWLPLALIGFGLARLCIWQRGTREALRVLAVVAVFALATAAALQGTGDVLPGATACVLGVALGLHVESTRRAGLSGCLAAAICGAVAALAVAQLPRALDGVAVALGLVLMALVLDGPRVGAPGALPRGWFGRLLLWALVAGLVVAAGACADRSQAAPLAGLGAAVLAAAACGRLALALGAAAAAFVTMFVAAPTLHADATVLARSGDVAAVYLRSDQQVQVRLGAEVLAAAGPDRDEEPLLLALLHAFVAEGDVVTMLGRGTGRLGPALRREQRGVVEVRDPWPDVVPLLPRATADGPVAPPTGARDACSPGPAFARPLADLPDASRQLLCVCELPIAATAHRATVTFQRQLRRVVGEGLVLQPIALDRVAPAQLDALLRAAGAAHRWNGVYKVGDAAVLVSGSRHPSLRGGFERWSDDARWALHRAHLDGPADLRAAFVGTLCERPDGDAGRDSAGQLLARSLDVATEPPRPEGLLAFWQRMHSEMLRAKGRLLVLADDPRGRGEAASIAAQFVPIGAPRPWLQAALGLQGRDGVALRDPRLQSRCAHALDPTFFGSPPAVFGTLERPVQELGDLEDEHRVQVSERLAQRCSGENPLAVALRARFPSRCARSLVAALARGPLPTDQALALRELADPFVIDEAARLLLPAGRWPELLTYWRADLPLPTGLREAAGAVDRDGRKRLAIALRTHLDPSCHQLLADLLLDDDLDVRTLAAAALHGAVGERVPFDAKWPRSRREDAASRLRDLHNRRP
ncbi:MAG: hypothetical protein ACE37K_25500 [Planctomycetota bacterium]